MEPSTPMFQIKGSVRDSVWSPRVRNETPEEGQRAYRQKRCDYNYKDHIINANILANKKCQTLSQIRQNSILPK